MILEQIYSKPTEHDHNLNSVLEYHFKTGGKQLRAQIVMTEAQSLNLTENQSTTWAQVCELLHNATLIHDDIQDNDPLRRGQPSVWKKFGIAQAINAGDLLIFKAFSLAATLNSTPLISLLSQVSENLVHGQAMELTPLTHYQINLWENYQKMAAYKTGALFTLPIEGIRTLGNIKTNESYRNKWLRLGVCYQILDDLKDYLGLKQIGQEKKDIIERRLNALTSYLFKDTPQDSLLLLYLNANNPDSFVLKKICEQIEQHQIPRQLIQWINIELKSLKDFCSEETAQILFGYINKTIKNMEPQIV